MPPSPVVTSLRGWKENAASSLPVPTSRSPTVAPIAQAASSTTDQPSAAASLWIGPRSAGVPAWWTTSTRRVRRVCTRATVSAVTLSVAGSTSAKTGVAPV